MQWLETPWSIPLSVGAFVAGGVLIAVFGIRLARVVDHLADRTGLGEAVAGAVLLGGATSIAGLIVSVVAAAEGNASLAVSNSVGGIAAQTAFIVVADLTYRRANIEHAAASLTNIFSSLLMVVLLSVVLMGAGSPGWTVWEIHPATPVLLITYMYGLRLARSVGNDQMWVPRKTRETRVDVPSRRAQVESLRSLMLRFVALGAAVASAGYVVGQAGISLVATTGLGGTVVGTFLTSVITSLPELVTTVAAVRSGALTLAVGGVVGGNTFDILFVGAADLAYREGAVYTAITETDQFVLAWTMALVAVLGAGLIRRQRQGVGGIGFEGVTILGLYAVGIAVVAVMG
ncbi:MAG: sodium:calcium antiporter [Actinobacteria bacterium]|nr:sodium:calcium antiporter [Actinomycetota bacterium]